MNDDRLSNLPEALQLHILSFLDTRQAIQTCLLSKQWVNLWTLLSDFDFDFKTSDQNLISSFDSTVETLLTLRDHDSIKINSFVFIRHDMIITYLGSLLDFVASHNAHSFTLNLPHYMYKHQYHQYSIAMERLCSTFGFLKSMKLISAKLDHLLRLEQLVTLDVEYVIFNTLEDFSGCPNLERLTLECCFVDDGKRMDLVVVGPKLSRLTISCHNWSIIKLVLSTPRLTFFKCKGDDPVFIESGDMPLLDSIHLDIHRPVYWGRSYVRKLITTLQGFSAAKIVRLSSRILEHLSVFPGILAREPSPFCNLKVLKVRPNATTSVTTYLLRNCPNGTILVE